jgi:hypothetical protein
MDPFRWFFGPSPRARRFASCWAASVLLSGCGEGLRAAEAPAVGAAPPGGNPRITPALEAKLSAAITNLTEAKRVAWKRRILEETQEIRKVTGLSEAAALTLETAKGPIEAGLKEWSAEVEIALRHMYESLETAVIESSLQYYSVNPLVQFSQRFTVEVTRPWEHATWTAAVAKTLSPEQLKAWTTAQKQKRERLQAQASEAAKRWVDLQEANSLGPLLAFSGEVTRAAGLPAERAEILIQFTKDVCDKRRQALQQLAEKSYLSDDAPRPQFTHDTWDLKRMEKIPLAGVLWEEGLAGVLSAAEVKTIKTLKEEHRHRQARAIAGLLLVTMDARVALTAAQRRLLQPIALKLVQEDTTLWRPDGWMYRPLYAQKLYPVAAKLTRAEQESILDPRQRRRWEAVAEVKTLKPLRSMPRTDPAGDAPEENEKALSTLLCEAGETRRADYLEEITLVAEDIIRTASPSADKVTRLFTATRGSVEQKMDAWRPVVEQQARSVIAEQPLPTEGDIVFRVDFRYYGQTNVGGPLEKTPVWLSTVENVLSADEKSAWQKELDERAAFTKEASIAIILANFDLQHPISSQQWSALEPLIGKVITDYASVIPSSMGISRANPPSYFVQNPFLPFPALEEELKGILTKEQWKEWSESDDYVKAQAAWKRVKEQKEGIGRAVIRG